MKYSLLLIPFLLSISSWAKTNTTPQAMNSNTVINSSGQVNYSIPIDVPPGTNGLQPEITLNYASAGRTNVMGKGWSIGGVSMIQRAAPNQTQDGSPGEISWDYSDRFVLDGQRLIAIKDKKQNILTSVSEQNNAYGKDGTVYHTASETWNNVVSYSSEGDGPKNFVVKSREGKIFKYGSTSNSRILAQGKSEVRFWLVDSVIDVYGNTMVFTYLNEGSNTGAWYPDTIKYNYNKSSSRNFQRVVKFIWESRKDSLSQYTNGSDLKINKRLKSIRTYLKGGMIREYPISYNSSLTALSQVSIVKSIQECFKNDNCLQPSSYVYQSDASVGFDKKPTTNSYADTSGTWLPMDVNGDGMQDIVRMYSNNGNKGFQNFISRGDGTYAKRGGYNTKESSKGSWLPIDANGDGLTDIVRIYSSKGQWMFRVFLSKGTGSYNKLNSTQSKQDDDGYFQVGDFDGDGRGDLIQIFDEDKTKHFKVYTSKGDGKFDRKKVYDTKKDQEGDWRVMDANGDGRTDVVFIYKPKSTVYLKDFISKGNGDFQSMDNWDTKKDEKDSEWLQGDFNGDGLADLLNYFYYDSYTRFRVFLSRGNGKYSKRDMWNTGRGDQGEWKVMDANGDGKTDVVNIFGDQAKFTVNVSKGDGSFIKPKSDYKTKIESETWMPMDVNGDGVSDIVALRDSSKKEVFTPFLTTSNSKDLLSEVSNGLGLTNKFYYKTTSDNSIFSRGPAVAYPKKIIQGSLYVVSEHQESTPQITLSKTYRYSGSQVMLNGLGSMGFGNKTEISSADSTATTYFYNQTYPFNGRNDSILIKRISDSAIMGRSVFQYYSSGKYISNPYLNVYQVLLSDQYTDSYYFGTKNFTSKKSFDYDRFGNLTQLKDVADTSKTSNKVFTNSTFKNDTTNWYIGYLTAQKVGSSASKDMSKWEPDRNLKWDQVTYLDNMGVYEKKSYDNINKVFYTIKYKYDSFGNIIKTTDPNKTAALMFYEKQYNTFLYKTQTPPNKRNYKLSTIYNYDARYGKLKQQIDPNGKITNYCIDAFGRVASMQVSIPSYVTTSDKACTSSSSKVATVQTYQLSYYGSTNVAFTTKTRNDWNESDSRSWDWKIAIKNPHGLEIKTKEKAWNGDTVFTVTSYYNNGKVRKKSLPYYKGDDPIWDKFYYNAYGTITKVIADGVVTQYVLKDQQITKTLAYGTDDATTSTVFVDSRGKVIQRKDADGSLTRFSYDLLGRPDTIIDPSGIKNITTYNSIGKKLSVSNPDMGMTRYIYSTKGLLEKEINSNKDTITYVYDNLARVIQTNASNNSTPTVTKYTYDEQRTGFSNWGELTTVTSSINGVLQFKYQYDYDVLRNAIRQQVNVDGLSDTYIFQNEYDPMGSPIKQVMPDGSISISDYYDNGLLKKVYNQDNINGNLQSKYRYLNYPSYSALGQPLAVNYKNGDSTTYQYGGSKNTLEKHKVNNGNNVLINNQFTFNNIFQITKIQDKRSLKSGEYNESQSFYYSNVGRLDSAFAVGTYGSKYYQYKSDGSIKLKDGISFSNGDGHRVITGKKDGNKVYKAQYDNLGNIIYKKVNGVEWKYVWDNENNLITIKKNNQLAFSYLYDYSGKRIREENHLKNTKTFYASNDFEIQVNSANQSYYTKYIYGLNGKAVSITNPQKDVKITSQNDLALQQYTGWTKPIIEGFQKFSLLINPSESMYFKWVILLTLAIGWVMYLLLLSKRLKNLKSSQKLSPIAMWCIITITFLPMEAQAQIISPDQDSTQTLYYHNDHIKSLAVITDSNGNQVFRGVYDPYGALVSGKSMNLSKYEPSFATGEWEEDSGLYHMGARYYDPFTARFISADTQVGKSVFTHDAFNRYAYAGGNPVEYADPSGHIAFLAVIGIGVLVGALIGAATEFAIQAIEKGVANVDWGMVGISFAIGAISGTVGAFAGVGVAMGLTRLALEGVKFAARRFAIEGISLAVTRLIGVGIGAISGAATGVTSQFTSNLLSRVILNSQIPLESNLWQAALIGGALGGAGGYVGATRMSSPGFKVGINTGRGVVKTFRVKTLELGPSPNGTYRATGTRFGTPTFGEKYGAAIGVGLGAIGDILTLTSYNDWYSDPDNTSDALGAAFGESGQNQPIATFYNGTALLSGDDSNGDILGWMESVNGVIKEWTSSPE